MDGRIDELDFKIESILANSNDWQTPEEKEKLRLELKKKLLKELKDELALETEAVNEEKKLDNAKLADQSLKFEIERQEEEIYEYQKLGGLASYENDAKRKIFKEQTDFSSKERMDEYKKDAKDLLSDVEKLSEKRREERQEMLKKLLPGQSLNQSLSPESIERLTEVMSDDERKKFETIYNSLNGQIDLMQFMEAAPEVVERFIDIGDKDIQAVLRGIEKEADVLESSSEKVLFHKGITYQDTIRQTEENEKRFIKLDEIRKSTEGITIDDIEEERDVITTGMRTQETKERE